MKLVQEKKAKRAKSAKEAKEVKEALEAKEVRISNVAFPPKFSTNGFHYIVTSTFPPRGERIIRYSNIIRIVGTEY